MFMINIEFDYSDFYDSDFYDSDFSGDENVVVVEEEEEEDRPKVSNTLLTLKGWLPTFKVTEDFKNKEPECSICFSDFMIDEELPELPCKHVFHEQCLLQWFKYTRTCPLCRQNVEPEREWLLPEVCFYADSN